MKPLVAFTGVFSSADYLRAALLTIAYCVLQLVSRVEFNSESIGEIIWLPSGIAIASLLLYGWRLWPGIFIGSFFAFLIDDGGWYYSIIAALGNTIGPLLAYCLLTRAVRNFDIRLERTKDVWCFFLCAAILSPLANAMISSSPYLTSSSFQLIDYPVFLLNQWMPHIISVALISPLFLMMATREKAKFIVYQRPLEFLALLVIFTLVKWQAWNPEFIEINSSTGILIMIPFFVWSVTRLGQRATAVLAVSIFIVDIVMYYQTIGAYSSHSLYASHLGLWQAWIIFTLFSQLVAVSVNQFREMANALSTNEERLRISQQFGGVGTWESDIETDEQIWSENCWNMLGISKKEKPMLSDFLEVVYPDDRNNVVHAMQRHIHEGVPYDIGYRVRQENGSLRWMRSVGKLESKVSGKPTRFRGIVQDITESKTINQSLQESEYRYRTLMEDASDAILICDLNGDIEEINRAGEELLGYTNHEIQHMNIMQIQPMSLVEIINISTQSFNNREKLNPLESTVTNKEGKRIEVEVRPTIVELKGRRLLQEVLIDLTERKRLEKEHAEAEIKHRNVLVREVHHRIKNNLQGVTGILRQYAATHPEVAEPLDQAISLVQSVAVVHGLQGRVAQTQVRLCELANAIALNNQNLWRAKITLDIPSDWTPCRIIEPETVPIALILNELISNAVKHGTPFSTISMKLRRELDSDHVVVSVANLGKLPAEFDINRRSDLGTGLQLVMSLMPRIGATLAFEQRDREVVAKLQLLSPVIVLERNEYESNAIN